MSETAGAAAGLRPIRICMVAGEPSGDALGAGLMRALVAATDGAVRFSGVGGPEMTAAGHGHGFTSLFPMEELSVGGLVEIVPHIPRLLRRIRDVVRLARESRPDVLVTIDSPGFAFRVGKALKDEGIPHVHYVAPTVWAWRPGRAREVARFLDHLLLIFPFEAPDFERWGLPCTFVGHPVAERGLDAGDGPAFRRAHGIDPDQPLLCLLPGSRRAEAARLLPVFGGALERLEERFPDLAVVVPAADAVHEIVARAVRGWRLPAVVTTGPTAKRDAFAAADLALAASGTVTYELAMAGLPMIVTYRLSWLTGAVLRLMMRTPHVSAVNLILGREVAPEYLQGACTAGNLSRAVGALLDDPAARRRQAEDLGDVAQALGRDVPPASETAARAVLGVAAAARAG